MRTFKKILVANRGEIAIRIFRACRELGINTVAIYSEEDKTSLFRSKADESYQIGIGKAAVDAYLDIDGIIDLALLKGVDAIHPGYGFLAENQDFARACERNGIAFIGPAANFEQLGDKISSKIVAKRPTFRRFLRPADSFKTTSHRLCKFLRLPRHDQSCCRRRRTECASSTGKDLIDAFASAQSDPAFGVDDVHREVSTTRSISRCKFSEI